MGKEKVVNHHRDVPYRVLERIPQKGVLDSTGSDCGNIIIHGDNLEALKALLPRFEGKVDCIYIDPTNPDRFETCPDLLRHVQILSYNCPQSQDCLLPIFLNSSPSPMQWFARPSAILSRGGLIEAWGQGGSRTYTLSKSVYARVGEGIGYVRQADIDKVRHEELILKLAKQNDGVITKRDVEQLLHVGDKQAYRKILKLVQEGKLEKVGAGRATRYLLV